MIDVNKIIENAKSIIIFGTGSGGKNVLEVLKKLDADSKVCVFLDRERKEDIYGFPVDTESNFASYMQDDSILIIGAQYYKEIYERLSSYVEHMCECLVINLFCNHNIYPEKDAIIPFWDEKYTVLHNMVNDTYSKDLIYKLSVFRDRPFQLVMYKNWQNWSGDEDYWKRIPAIRKHKNAVIIDGGAYIGDSIKPLCQAVGEGIQSYYAFEPDNDSFQRLLSKKEQLNNMFKFMPFNKGLWSSETKLYFQSDNFQKDGSHFEGSEGECIETVRLDDINFPDNTDIFIKMDIEGSELEALKGAENLIKQRKPSLAICVYHMANDIIKIPFYLKSIVPEYKIYLAGGGHTICIAQIE